MERVHIWNAYRERVLDPPNRHISELGEKNFKKSSILQPGNLAA
jgi:hypothetical protein